ncbi:MAG: ribonuclease III [Crocinitomicaceae bacterium]|nr:ribonuclease III [Crocinitomicaceae bacterium]
MDLVVITLPWFSKNLKSNTFFQRIFGSFSKEKLTPFQFHLKELLGYTPNDWEIYERALRHKSLFSKKGENNERLEFLGDSILDSIVAEYLFDTYPKRSEGFLTKMRSKIVSRKTLNELATRMELRELVQAAPEIKGDRTSLYGNALEALVGAIYRDQGYERTKEYVLKHILEKHLDLESLQTIESDYKSRLLEWGQKERIEVSFSIEELPQTTKGEYRFKAALTVGELHTASAIGTSKKRAEQQAAQIIWQEMFNK